MRILVTGCDRSFARTSADHLNTTHEVVRVGRTASGRAQGAELFDPEQATPLAEGCEAVLHVDAWDLETLASESDEATIDRSTRGGYVVLEAAKAAGLDRAVLISTLAPFAEYPDKFVLDESFRPMPEATATSLASYLVEQTFREVAREGPITCICLRFGPLDDPDGTPTDLALKSIERALTMPLDGIEHRWLLYHVSGTDRFPLRAAVGEPLSLEA